MNHPALKLARDLLGRLTLDTGSEVLEVVPVRAFPIAAPEAGLALVTSDGHEAAWIERLDQLPAEQRLLIEEELASREFVPEIRGIRSVSSFATPSTWQVSTDRGETELILKGEEDIRRLTQSMLLIADAHGIQFLVRDIQSLDKASRRLLDRFL